MVDAAFVPDSRRRFNPWPAVIFIALACLAVLFLAPTAGVLLSSIKTTRDIALGALWTIPSELYWGNYAEVLGNPAVHRYFLNTLLVTAPATVASIALGSLAGYVFAKLPFRGSNLLFLAIVSGMFFPPQVDPDPTVPALQRRGSDRHAVPHHHHPHRDGHPHLHAADAQLSSPPSRMLCARRPSWKARTSGRC